jgi:hypothetical protein
MWPADPTTDLARHYEVMDACGLGSGRDDWAVAIEAAARFSWPTARLRSTIANPPPIDGRALMARVRTLAVLLVRANGITDSYRDEGPNDTTAYVDRTTRTVKRRETHNDVVEGVVDDVIGGVERAVSGELATGEDFESMGELVTSTVDGLVEGGESDDAGEDTGRPISQDVQTEVVGIVERLPGWGTWAEEAAPADLAHAAAVAAAVVDLLNRLTPEEASVGDKRRGEVAYLASWCGAELVPAGFDKQLSALGDLVQVPPTDQSSRRLAPGLEEP